MESQGSKCGSHTIRTEIQKGGMRLYPKRTKFRKYQRVGGEGYKTDGTQLGSGKYGPKSCEAGRISSETIEAARRATSRRFRRNGRIWVRVFADTPITSKPTEVRMGKGKGNPTGWVAHAVTGQISFETDGVGLSLVQEAATLAAHRLRVSTKFVQWS